jgi:pyrimidine-specific ribonucleoside hydrolase
LDGDPGHDDAIAWMLAASSPELQILSVTSASGNQSIEKTTYNALRVMALLGLRAPMAAGCPKPLVGPAFHAPSVHGESGLDGPALPEPVQTPVDLPAPDLMAQVILSSPQPVTIVSTGPLTNTAALLLSHPEVKGNIARISLMGGGVTHGNWTPAAEFNILVDPESADLVFRSGLPITMAGLDVTEKALLLPADFARIRAVGGPVAPVVADWLDFFYRFHKEKGYPGAPIHDGVAVAWLLAPQLFTSQEMYVEVETGGQYSRGATIGDPYHLSGKAPNTTVLLDVDREAFADLFVTAVSHWKEG